jgi:DNA-binding transcriptional LysR family regulator
MDKMSTRLENRIGGRLKLRDLHILSNVIRWGSMAKAAGHLAMSQPAVSESVASLEATLRVRLLERTSYGVEPTVYAHALLKHGNVIFDEVRQGIRDIEFLTDPTAGEVRIASPETFASGVLPAAIARLSRRYPRIIVTVVQADTTSLDFHELRDRKIDLALARLDEASLPDDLHTEILFDDTHRVVAGSRSRWARRRKIALAELRNEAWVLPPTQILNALITEAFRNQGLEPPRARVGASSILLRNHLLATGRFLTVLPSSVLRYYAKQWSLKALPVDLNVKSRSIAMVTLKNRMVSPVVQLFMQHLRDVSNAQFKPRAAR